MHIWQTTKVVAASGPTIWTSTYGLETTYGNGDRRGMRTHAFNYCLFTPLIYGCCSSHTFRSWWTVQSAQCQQIGCNKLLACF